MKFSYEYANKDKSSVLLRFHGVIEEQPICLLVDSGAGVDIDRVLGDDEYLTGILLTHLHADHYATIDENLRDGAEIYASETTIDLLSTMINEVQRTHNSSFDTEAVRSAATAVEDELTIGGGLRINPVPAGHTPGAAGFCIEFSCGGETETILITGDFTRRNVAGYSGLPVKDVDMLFLTGVSSNRFEEDLNTAVETAIEQSLAGSPCLVSATSLDGVHFAYIVGQFVAQSNRESTVSIVGHAAKIYDRLDYDVPHVESYPNYDGSDIIYRNDITISGPSVPTTGGSKLLFDEIKQDPNAALIQLDGDNRADTGDRNCTVHRYQFSNHPTQEAIDEFVELTSPQSTVILHQTGDDLVAYRDKYNSAVWAPANTSTPQVLFENGEWKTPPWVSEYTARRIASRRREMSDIPLPDAEPNLGFERNPVDLTAEGVEVNRVTSRYDDTDERTAKYTTRTPIPPQGEAIGSGAGERELAASQQPSSDDNGDASAVTDRRPDQDATVEDVQNDTDDGIQAESNEQTQQSDSASVTQSESAVELRTELTTIKYEIESLQAQIGERAVAEVTHTDENTLVLRIADANERFEIGEIVNIS